MTNRTNTIAYIACNPANLRYSSSNNWKGQIGSYKGFCKFQSDFYGVRALVKTLISYIDIHGLLTPLAIISRFAPSSENDTESYVHFVCSVLSCTPDDVLFDIWFDVNDIADVDTLYMLCSAICNMESHFSLSRSLFNSVFNDIYPNLFYVL